MSSISQASIKAQIEKVSRMASDTHLPFVSFATEIDGTHENSFVDVSEEIFLQISCAVEKKYSNATFMMIAAGVKSCAIFIHCGVDAKLNGRDWLAACNIYPTVSTAENHCFAVVPLENPMKDKEQISGAAFAYLRKNNLMEEEEETPPFDFESV